MVELTPSDSFFAELIVLLVLGISFTVLGILKKMPELLFFSGLVWILGAVTVFDSLNVVWIVIGLGLGLVMLIEGGLILLES